MVVRNKDFLSATLTCFEWFHHLLARSSSQSSSIDFFLASGPARIPEGAHAAPSRRGLPPPPAPPVLAVIAVHATPPSLQVHLSSKPSTGLDLQPADGVGETVETVETAEMRWEPLLWKLVDEDGWSPRGVLDSNVLGSDLIIS